MLRAEADARLSDATQEAYGAAEMRDDADWLDVTADLQTRLLTEAGVPANRMAAALWLLRSAASLFPADPLCRIGVHVVHNRARAGELAAGDAAPDVPLYALGSGSAPTTLRAACDGAPTLLVAGSFT